MNSVEEAIEKYEDKSARGCDHNDFCAGWMAALEWASKTTHCAVIDEHGEIVQAFKIASYRNAEFLCKNLVKSMDSHDHDTSDWTVKGVTVHE